MVWPPPKVYHTQENRYKELEAPIPSDSDEAWLGEGIYFWTNIEDAHFWGRTSKKKTGSYQVYEAKIGDIPILDTVFNAKAYFRWLGIIEDECDRFFDEFNEKPKLRDLHQLFGSRGIWQEVGGILFQDLHNSREMLKVQGWQNAKGKWKYFNYKKRLQLVVYNIENVRDFKLVSTNKVSK